MRSEPRRALGLLLGVALAGCSAWQSFVRPEGDGGWSEQQRHAELARAATAAGVPYGDALAGGPASPSAAAPQQARPMAADVAPRRTAIAAPAEANATSAPTPTAPERRSGAALSRLDLPQALAMADRGNRRIAEATRQLDATREQVYDVRGKLLPGTNANARYTWYTDAQTTSVQLPPGLLPPGTAIPIVKVRDAENGTVNAVVNLPLDLSGELRHTLDAAQAGYRGEQARVWAVTLEQQVRVVRAYFDTLEALRLREVAEQTLRVYREQLDIARNRYENGRLTKNDLLTFEVAARDAEQEILRRDLVIDQTRWELNDAIGVEVDRADALVDVRGRPDVPTIDEALRQAYQQNPVLVSLLEEQQRLDETATALVRSRLPRFFGGGAVDYQTSDLLTPAQIGSGFVGLTWDLGTDTRREAQIAEARIEADKNKVAIERQMRELEAAVRTAQRATEERLAAHRTAELGVTQAEENLAIRRQQFDVGRAQSDDVLIAERLLSSQRATLSTALYQAHARRAELQRLMGLPITGANDAT
jgi:outer membrane protein TolC